MARRGDINPNWLQYPSRALDFLFIAEFWIHFLDSKTDQGIIGELKKRKNALLKWQRMAFLSKILLKKYITFQVWNIHFPTISSNWLNMLKLGALIDLTKQEPEMNSFYRWVFDQLYNYLSDEKNPFFDLLYYYIKDTPIPNSKLWNILAVLQSFHIKLYNTSEALDYSWVVKNGQYRQEKISRKRPLSDSLLPVYLRPWYVDNFKQPQRSVKHEFDKPPFLGDTANWVDFLITYHLLLQTF